MNILIAMKNGMNVGDLLEKVKYFDAVPIAQVAVSYGLYEDAFAVFEKSGKKVLALQVLCRDIGEFVRARHFAEKCRDPAVWSALAADQLQRDMVKEAIDSFIEAKDHSDYKNVMKIVRAKSMRSTLQRFDVLYSWITVGSSRVECHDMQSYRLYTVSFAELSLSNAHPGQLE